MTARRTTTSSRDAELDTAVWGDGPPAVVLLHDGLGSIAQWRDVPASIAERTGRAVLAYDRAGHGRSRPVPDGPWPAAWLHHEAEVLADLLVASGAEEPVLVGHSDGGSIALLHAAGRRAGGDRPAAVAGVVTLAAHTWVEQLTVDRIAAMRRHPEPIVAGLGRFHDHPAALFEAWSGVWVSDAFRPWDVRATLGTIDAPVLVVQGDADEYASPEHATETAAAIGDGARCRLLPGGRHLLHRQDPELVTDLVADFVAEALA